jgi:peptidoglycan/xylan/chitin deacetylase (PgdA/CDA1 family)
MVSIRGRAINWYKRNAARPFYRNRADLQPTQPVISFSFDDFPRSALLVAGEILKERDLTGTYFASLGLMGKESPSGRICTPEDVVAAFEQGHELGSHTFSHCHSWNTDGRTFEQSLIENQDALQRLIPGASFRSFAYPISLPNPGAKRACARHFECSRGGGQTYNIGPTDLNQLSAFFLEKVDGSLQPIRDIIEQNNRAKGWLIFATHDVSSRPSQYGCTPEFFREVVQCALDSGARIATVSQAIDMIHENMIHESLV